LRAKFGFTDQQIRPYTFDVAPFLVDKNLIQMGYVTNEPFLIKNAGGFSPNVFLIADEAGYNSYATTLETTSALVEKNPDVVQRFVDASIEGWYSYLNGNPAPGDELIRKENPEMPADLLAFTRAKIKEYGIVDSGESIKLGIGAMTDARWKSFFEAASSYGLYSNKLDYAKAYTLRFVNKGHGVTRD
jgi:NitT/TauT family transport system substrate-binding protein